MSIVIYIARVNQALRKTRKELKTVNASLEEIIKQKTQHLYEKSTELEAAYLNEKHLRSILRTVADVNQMLITARSLEELLDKAALFLSSNESFKSAKICTAKDEKLSAVAYYGAGNDKEVNPIEQKAYEENKSIMVTNLSDPILNEEYRQKATKYGIKAIYTVPLISSSFTQEALGTLTICTDKEKGFSAEEQGIIEELAGDIGFAINAFTQKELIEQMHEERVKSYLDFIDAMVSMIEQRDSYTAGHTQRVAHYAELIAKEMELPDNEIKKLVQAAKLHDIGKVVTPDSVLLKPGSLSKLEYELIKEHVNAGVEVLGAVELYKELADIVAYHHERFDGSGYPKGKKGGEIPLAGHILAVADSFDAMTTNRIYKPRKTVKESLEELVELGGRWYHPGVVSAAVKALSNIEVDETIDQLNFTMLEEERLGYFFKDRLTKLYNEEYLTLTINGRSRHKKPDMLYIVSLVNFTKYNKENTWEGGNLLLSEFATYLTNAIPDKLICRAWGDKFAIADFDGDLEAIMSSSPIKKAGIEYKTKLLTQIPSSVRDILNNI